MIQLTRACGAILGARFSGPERGVWHAAFELATAQSEVGFQKTVQLAEIGRFEDSVTYDDYVADFTASFHDLRRASGFHACLHPASYRRSQRLAERLLDEGSLGIVYPSVRRARGTCLACFRPTLVANLRPWPGLSVHVGRETAALDRPRTLTDTGGQPPAPYRLEAPSTAGPPLASSTRPPRMMFCMP